MITAPEPEKKKKVKKADVDEKLLKPKASAAKIKKVKEDEKAKEPSKKAPVD